MIDLAVKSLIAVGLFLLWLSIHPFTTYPLSLLLIGRTRRATPATPAPEEGGRPSVAICMCAYNEERVVEQKVQALIAMAERYGNATVHVYADGSTDRTAEIVQRFADRIDLIVSPVRTGKTFGMNQLVARSDSELILFTDANVVSNPDALEKLVAPFADSEVGCASARLHYSNPSESAASETGASYWALEEWIKTIESDTVGMIGVDGAMFAMRRSLHQPPPPNLIDDLTISLSVLIQGARLVSVSEAVVYERSAVRNWEEFMRKKRIGCQAMNVHRFLWPKLRRMPFLKKYAYISHRLIKWLTPFLLTASLIALIAAAIITWGFPLVAMVLAALVAAVLVGEMLKFRPAGLIFSIFASLVGVMVGVLQSVFTSENYVVWNPASSVRSPEN